MKKILALAALAAAFSMSVPAFAGCGSNVKRDAATKAPPSSSQPVPNGGPGVGTKRN